jgi:hypothetical protein
MTSNTNSVSGGAMDRTAIPVTDAISSGALMPG